MYYQNVLEKRRFPDEGGRAAINKFNTKFGRPSAKGERGYFPKLFEKHRVPEEGGGGGGEKNVYIHWAGHKKKKGRYINP